MSGRDLVERYRMQRLGGGPSVARRIIADIDVPVAAGGVGEEEAVHRPAVGRCASMDGIARHALKGVERRIAPHGVSQPQVHGTRFSVIDHGRRRIQNRR